MNQVGLDGTAWGGGTWWPSTYVMFMGAPGETDSAYLDLLEGYFGSGSVLGEPHTSGPTGTQDADSLFGTAGEDQLLGHGGGDVLNGNAGADLMDGGTGINTVAYASSSAAVDVDLKRTSQLNGDAQGDVLVSVTNVTGSSLGDVLSGDAAGNVLSGLDGDDVLTGRRGNDLLSGGAGSDQLNGGAGEDSMSGGGSDDTYVVNCAGDAVSELRGQDIDLVRASISYTLAADVEQLTLTGARAIDGTGNAMANLISGNRADNRLDGGNGDDELHGMVGSDRLNGQLGSDLLTGGGGGDTFVFDTALDLHSNVDRISDFSVADDRIELDQSVFGALNRGALASDAFATGTSAQDSADRIIYDMATGNIYYDADGNGARAQVLFAQVAAGTALTSADFLIAG